MSRVDRPRIFTLCLAFFPIASLATEPVIDTEDVSLFYDVYDAADGRPSAEQLQREYLDRGTAGLQVFAEARNITGERIAETLDRDPGIYANARDCLEILPNGRERLIDALQSLGDWYPEARFPPVTVAIGRGRPVAIGSAATGIQVGLEALCATDFLHPDVEDRFVFVTAHEFIHVQQELAFADLAEPTVLQVSLIEGAAEFIAELIAGEVAYATLVQHVEGREQETEKAFLADIDNTDLSDWVFNTTPDNPGDLGYWVGYRIVKSYFHHAPDKRAAVRRILEMRDAKAFLEESGWKPGIRLDGYHD